MKDIGKKIKIIAKILTLLGIVCSIIGGFTMLVGESDTAGVGWIIVIIGCVVSYLAGLFLYSYGIIVEKNESNLAPRENDEQNEEE